MTSHVPDSAEDTKKVVSFAGRSFLLSYLLTLLWQRPLVNLVIS